MSTLPTIHVILKTITRTRTLKGGGFGLTPDVIADMAEDAIDEAVAQSGVENDDGHGAGEEIVGAADENVVDHVSHTSTHTYNPTIN